MANWLAKYWVPGASFMAMAQLALFPLMFKTWWPQFLLIALHSPVYMLHQVEEHSGDRFRTYVNQRLFGGLEVLTTLGVLWINLPGVWGVNLASLYAAILLDPGFGLTAPYLMLVNGLSHCGMFARTRKPNPGLWTSLLLFLPLSVATLVVVAASWSQHALGLGLAIVVHLLIIVGTARRFVHLRRDLKS